MQKIADEIGYTLKTTFWEDFSIAENFGKKAIQETAEHCFNEWKNDYKFLTELIMVINHKSWEYADKNPDLSEFYVNLYYEYDDKAINFLSKNEENLKYYLTTLD